MPRPLIGITSYLEPARWGDWIREAALVAKPCLREIDRAGGMPVVLPPARPSGVVELLARLDAVVLTAGAPVDPDRFGEEPHERAAAPDPRRDAFELALVRAAIEKKVPVLGIERGAHVLNVAAGGSLIQYLPEVAGGHNHAPDPVRLSRADVSVSVTSRLGKALGDRAEVLESHEQGFNQVASGLSPVAWAQDGSVEAVEIDGHPFGIGVQWFPEEGEDRRLLAALVAAAEEQRG